MIPAFAGLVTGLVCLLTALLSSPAAARPADAGDDERAAQVKAGMVLKFIPYTQWPEESFASSSSPIVVVLLGDGAVRGPLEETLRAQRVQERDIEVRRLAYPALPEGGAPQGERDEYLRQLRAAHVVFLCESERDRVRTVLGDLDGADALTVSDTKNFGEQGGMLALSIRRGKVAFDANAGEIQATGLKVSSYLLRLADRTVKTQEP